MNVYGLFRHTFNSFKRSGALYPSGNALWKAGGLIGNGRNISSGHTALQLKPKRGLLGRVLSTPFSRSESSVGKSSSHPELFWKPARICGVSMVIEDYVGSLRDVLGIIANHGVSVSRIESRPTPLSNSQVTFYIHFKASFDDPKMVSTLSDLEKISLSGVTKLKSVSTPWFPRREQEIDQFSRVTLQAGEELASDHPGFNDASYRERRDFIVSAASTYKMGEKIERVLYTAEENEAWGKVYRQLAQLYPEHACEDYLKEFREFERLGIFKDSEIPQLQDVSEYLQSKTGFSLRPVPGLLSGRDFLNALAFRNFFSTQYIRHPSVPFYTPEPDIIHEVLGHAPMLASQAFADFSQLIGLASLGATDSQIEKLATCYWFSVEFGLLYEDDTLKAYGAGLLSSYGELQHATSPTNKECEIRAWNPYEASVTEYPITTYQPIYYAGTSMLDIKDKMLEYCQAMHKPFSVRYDPEHRSIITDVHVSAKPLSIKF